jgi:hypothetical protein
MTGNAEGSGELYLCAAAESSHMAMARPNENLPLLGTPGTITAGV